MRFVLIFVHYEFFLLLSVVDVVNTEKEKKNLE